MAVYRDIDSDVRINGSLMLPSGSLTIGGINLVNELSNKANNARTISAGTGLSGGGNLSEDRTISVSFGTTAGTVAQGNHTHTFASLTSKPTTLAGYGITDAAASGHTHTFASLTSKPTTLSGYGITDAASSAHHHDATYLKLTGGTISGKIYGALLPAGNQQLIHHDSSTIYLGNPLALLQLESSTDPYVSLGGNVNYKIFHEGNFNPSSKLDTTANAVSASKLATARNIALTGGVTGNANFDGSGNLSIATTVTNNSHSHTIANVTGLQDALNEKAPNSSLNLKAPYQEFNASIRGLTWSRILQLTNGTATGHSIILNVSGTRTGVVFNTTFLVTISHNVLGNIVQIGSTSYSTFKIRTVVNSNGEGYIEVYDDANGISNTTLQGIKVTYVNLKNTTITAFTSFTDGSTVPTNYSVKGEIRTVNGATLVGNLVGDVTGNVTGNAASASKWATARTLTLNGAITGSASMDGSGNITLSTTANHTHNVISWQGRKASSVGRDSHGAGLYTYGIYNDTNAPYVYGNILSFGGGPAQGQNEIFISWHSNREEMYFRGLRDTTDPWYTWRKVWHDGNFNPSNYLGTGASQTVGNNFTINGKLNVGNINNTHGDIVVYGPTGLPRIHLDGNASGPESSTNTNVYLSGDGHANFKGTVSINTLKVTARDLVENLNAQYLNGIQEVSFTKNITTVDNTGYGIIKGLEAIAYGGELHVDPGIAYTASGMRVEIPARAKVNMTPASTSSSRYDVVYIKGPSTSTQEGTFGYLEGGATKAVALAHALLNDAVVLAVVLRAVKQASITQSDIDNSVRDVDGTIGTKPLFLDPSTKHVKARYEVHAKKFKQDGQYLDYYYATLNSANTFNANQKINGRVHINAAGTLANTPTSANYGLRVGTDTVYIAIDGNEVLAVNDLNLRAFGGATTISGTGGVGLEGKVKMPQSVRTITIPKGQRSVTWTHNYGATTYVLALSPNSFARHVKWGSKVANSVVIEIDDLYDQDILIDCVLIGY